MNPAGKQKSQSFWSSDSLCGIEFDGYIVKMCGFGSMDGVVGAPMTKNCEKINRSDSVSSRDANECASLLFIIDLSTRASYLDGILLIKNDFTVGKEKVKVFAGGLCFDIPRQFQDILI